MAAAVASSPAHALQAQRPGAPVDLFEALLASCQRPVSTTPAPGFGRALQPYFGTPPAPGATPAPARKPPAARSAGNSPKRAQRKAAQAAAQAAATVSAAAAAKKAAKKNAAPKASPAPPAPFVLATPASWAGPGFCISPLPDQLPLPTTALLN